MTSMVADDIRIEDLCKHLGCSLLRKYFSAINCLYQKAPTLMFGRIFSMYTFQRVHGFLQWTAGQRTLKRKVK